MRERSILPRTLLVAGTLLVAVVLLGTAGYVVLERWSWFDAFYMTVTTITTVGGGEPAPLDVPGKWWTVAVVAFGFGVLTYTVLALVAYVIEGHLGEEFNARRMRRRIAKMHDHFILCGFGRVGREIARDFTAEKIAFVVVDINPDSLQRAAAQGFTVMNGNAADVGTLQAAGIERARGLVTAVDDDADNIYVTLSARILKPDLFIVARANAEDAERKIRLAGANRVDLAVHHRRPPHGELGDAAHRGRVRRHGALRRQRPAAARRLDDTRGLGVDRARARRAVPARRRSVRARAQARRRDALSPARGHGVCGRATSW